ncbi:MAG: FHA domain-containing protein [Pseudomonadales bacterium]|jgi:hypothetical protein|nr:FHA domain-containing protein [Pseudomonadales bacterium]MDP6472979.1 FHA domain-containing protein [Pseudomonadales bacterium]MDP6826265.1 FHA domain-containing protein [Pseudomonadales bacterium]MDP6970805.1 FHA domain-containing protein [Pseudomonadales bacterium]|tara:strand:+ start:6793 stop:7173 length:381 start_codon:yes stop_codon:yes gene_type:complete
MCFTLVLATDRFPVEANITAGKQIDNDILVAGEGVLDRHLRFEPVPRGLNVHPLAGATFSLNEREQAGTVLLMPGDRVGIGPDCLLVDVEYAHTGEAESWRLFHGDCLPSMTGPFSSSARAKTSHR